MYSSLNSSRINVFNEEGSDMIIDPDNNGDFVHQQQPLILSESSGEEHEPKAQKRRAETWVLKETQCLINLRQELHNFFNTSKSNKHLWEQISMRMREKGWERSPSMCTDKWRNLLKEFKKAKNQTGGGWLLRALFYDELEEYYRGKKRNAPSKSLGVVSYLQFSDKDNVRSALNLEKCSDPDGHPLAVFKAEGVVASGVPPWTQRGTLKSGRESDSTYGGRIISVKCGELIKRIGIDGSSKAIKEVIRATFGLRTKRAFWLEDKDAIVRTLDRDMPLGNYTLHLDEGFAIKMCLHDDPNHVPCHTVEKTFYNEDDFRDFLSCCGWIGLKDLNCHRNIGSMDDLHFGEVYHGLRMLNS